MAASCHTMLIPGREDNFLFYMGGVYTARSDGACVSLSLSLTDGWLPDITHSVRWPLILNITALTLLFIYCLYKPRHFCSQSKRRPTLKSLLKLQPRNERKWPQQQSNLAPRIAFVFSNRIVLSEEEDGCNAEHCSNI